MFLEDTLENPPLIPNVTQLLIEKVEILIEMVQQLIVTEGTAVIVQTAAAKKEILSKRTVTK